MSPNCFSFCFCSSSAIYLSTILHNSCKRSGSVSSIGKESGPPTTGLNLKYLVDDISAPCRAVLASPNTSWK